MKKRTLKRISMFLSALALCCALMPAGAASAAAFQREPLPDSVLYRGQVESILTNDKGEMTALRLSSEQHGEYVMHLSEETAWVDSGAKSAFDPASLAEGENVCVFHSPVATLSLPPQSTAFAVVRHIPQDADCAQYMEVDSLRKKGGALEVTASNGTACFTVNDDTVFLPYRTRNIVSAQDLRKGSRIMVWYADSEQTRAAAVMLLPGNDPLTRAAFLELLYADAGRPKTADAASPALAWAIETGLDAAEPDAVLTRSEAAALLRQYARARDLTGWPEPACLPALLRESAKTLLCANSPVTQADAEQMLMLVYAGC
ncbi:MAG: hypothetical protein ACI4JC_01950 [Faecalibacterium sp.]